MEKIYCIYYYGNLAICKKSSNKKLLKNLAKMWNSACMHYAWQDPYNRHVAYLVKRAPINKNATHII